MNLWLRFENLLNIENKTKELPIIYKSDSFWGASTNRNLSRISESNGISTILKKRKIDFIVNVYIDTLRNNQIYGTAQLQIYIFPIRQQTITVALYLEKSLITSMPLRKITADLDWVYICNAQGTKIVYSISCLTVNNHISSDVVCPLTFTNKFW